MTPVLQALTDGSPAGAALEKRLVAEAPDQGVVDGIDGA